MALIPSGQRSDGFWSGEMSSSFGFTLLKFRHGFGGGAIGFFAVELGCSFSAKCKIKRVFFCERFSPHPQPGLIALMGCFLTADTLVDSFLHG